MRRLLLTLSLLLAGFGAVEASCVLKVSTAVDIKLGPFVDSVDGVTPEPGLTISQGDVVLAKNGGGFAQKNDATSCTNDTGASGNYECPLNTTDTNTLGMLYIRVAESGALPVFLDCQVVSAAWYDFAFGTTALAASPGMTTDSGLAIVKDSTSVVIPILIRSATGAGKTGLTFETAGLKARYCRVDQGNADCATDTLATMTRGTWASGGFVEGDATDAAGIYWHGVPNAVVATGADIVEIYISGAADTVPTKKTIELVDTGLAAINTKIGTPVADLSTDLAAVDSDTGAIKAKTDVLTFTGANVHANVQATASALTYNLTGNVSGSVGSVTGNVGGDVVGTVTTVTGNVEGLVASGVLTAVGTYRKNVAAQRAHPVFIRSATSTQEGLAGATVAVTVSKDGAVFGAAQGSVAEVASGLYMFTPAQDDTNCDTCVYLATATNGVPFIFYIFTAP